MNNQCFHLRMVPQRAGRATMAAILLGLSAVLQGCATYAPSLASHNLRGPQALMTAQTDGGSESQSSAFIRLVSFSF
jgi:hypothetical protein